MSENYWIKYKIKNEIYTIRPQGFHLFLHEIKLLYARPDADILSFGYGVPKSDSEFIGLAMLLSTPADPTARNFTEEFLLANGFHKR